MASLMLDPLGDTTDAEIKPPSAPPSTAEYKLPFGSLEEFVWHEAVATFLTDPHGDTTDAEIKPTLSPKSTNRLLGRRAWLSKFRVLKSVK